MGPVRRLTPQAFTSIDDPTQALAPSPEQRQISAPVNMSVFRVFRFEQASKSFFLRVFVRESTQVSEAVSNRLQNRTPIIAIRLEFQAFEKRFPAKKCE